MLNFGFTISYYFLQRLLKWRIGEDIYSYMQHVYYLFVVQNHK